MNDRLPLTVLGGYLGAGKTTLLNQIIRSADEPVGIIVNDFGDVVIDESLIESHDGETMALANGCICCSMVDGLTGALAQMLAAEPRPARLVIEASGVADPAKIAAHGRTPGLQLDGVIVVADAETVRKRSTDRWVGDTVRQQLASADIVALSKLDLVSADIASSVRSWLATVAPGATVIDAPHGNVPLDLVFGSMNTTRTRTAGGGGHDAPPFVTDTVTLAAPCAVSDLRSALGDLPGQVVRAKGFAALDDGTTVLVQVVGKRVDITTVDRDERGGAIVIIGTPDLDLAAAHAAFARCT